MLKRHQWLVDPTIPRPEDADDDPGTPRRGEPLDAKRPLLCGFLKVRSEIVREGNIYRAISHLKSFCDTIVACDDASYDGTREYLLEQIPPDQLILVPPEQQSFRKELYWKQRMLEVVHGLRPHWIWWLDADEELEADGVASIREFCEREQTGINEAFRSHYIQLWRNRTWHRIDDGFDEGHYLKLWRWRPNLSFEVVEKTHHAQFPQQLHRAIEEGLVGNLPWKTIHWGNVGTNLRWKAIQYFGGLGGVERHLSFEKASFAKAAPIVPGILTTEPHPTPFSEADKECIRGLRDLKGLPRTFTVVIPTYNRGAFLDDTLKSLLAQTYDRWVALVVDDGSTDATPTIMRRWQDRDPRIFYARLPRRGAVYANEVGMSCAVEWTEWWTRLGSDDWFEPHKLELDAIALGAHDWVYGPYRVLREGKLAEMCNPPQEAALMRKRLLDGQFAISWANCAVRCSLLERARKYYGRFCDPRLRNMEDFLVNVRLARFAAPVFRGWTPGKVPATIINPTASLFAIDYQHDAIWRINPIGASSDTATTGSEDELTREIVASESHSWIEP